MLHLIVQIWGPLVVTALFGAVAGWFWHATRMRPRQRALEAERRRLRAELLDLAIGARPVEGAAPGTDDVSRRRIAELERQVAEARGRGAEADVLRMRLAALEQNSGPARSVAAVDVTDYTTRIAALEIEIEAARRKIAEAEALQARAAELQALATPVAAPVVSGESDLLKWRARYFEARTGFLEQDGRALQADTLALRSRAEELEALAAAPPADDAEKVQLIWRNRYLTERLKYVESTQAANEGVEQESDDRRRWRTRYLEQRLAHLETNPAPDAPATPTVDIEPFKARIAELETKSAEGDAHAAKLVDAEDEVIRARWTTRYLDQRVNYLEERMAKAVAAQEQAAKDIAAAREAAEHAAREAAQRAAGEAAERAAREAAERVAKEAQERAAREAAARVLTVAPTPPAPERVVVVPPPAAPTPVPEPVVFRMERPPTLSAARGGAPDDFTLIDGVSAHSDAALHGMGVHHFDQIAAWTPAHVAWVNQYFNLGGRIAQGRWVEQAQKLAAR